MTTVAFDGCTMAADRMVNIGDTPVRAPRSKIRRGVFQGDEALFGMSGAVAFSELLVEWLERGAPADRPPDLDSADDGACSVIVATRRGVTLFCNTHLGVPIGPTPWAVGSGANYALGAMAAGVKARRAVEIACTLDVNSGLGVDVLTLKRKT